MMKKMMLGICLLTAVTFTAPLALPSTAEANWSSWSDTSLNSSDGWKRTGAFSGKTTSRLEWSAVASTKTMWSNPQKRMVNSNNALRGNAVTLSNTNQIYTNSTNNALPGYNYYAQIRPAWNQVGTDTITSRHNAH
ncbi:hypothetical protein HXA35_19755 [Bacillus sp. A301a_S52]|nr:hypothetical protein [Bacillus sp. A301a_S52]